MATYSVPKPKLLRALLATALLSPLVTTPLLAAVYKHVDEKGNVTFSDAPQKKGDKPISLPEPSTYKPDTAPRMSTGEENKKTPAPKTVQYDSVVINTPENDAAIRSNSGDITVAFSSNPELQGNNQYVVFLDGSKIQESSDNSVTLTNLDRGSHSVLVQIQGDDGEVLSASQPVTFHLLRQSVIPRNNAP
jgi:hypothetical protein